mmetsp:Transcript_592/g.596  ORF Transcript_592/g.596 Transcript_592/m.596 type:complete len:100 (-) Transcript_592:9-308(-)
MKLTFIISMIAILTLLGGSLQKCDEEANNKDKEACYTFLLKNKKESCRWSSTDKKCQEGSFPETDKEYVNKLKDKLGFNDTKKVLEAFVNKNKKTRRLR